MTYTTAASFAFQRALLYKGRSSTTLRDSGLSGMKSLPGDEQALTSLPLVTRNYKQIIGLSPGIEAPVTNATDLGRGNGGLDQTSQCTGLSLHHVRRPLDLVMLYLRHIIHLRSRARLASRLWRQYRDW
jgi:hypothetical protein